MLRKADLLQIIQENQLLLLKFLTYC
jgi:hypothetical protein